MKLTQLLTLTLSGTLLLAACKKENNTGNTSNVTYQLSTQSALPGIANGSERTSAAYLAFNGGTASVSEIKFEAKGDNKIEYKSNANQTIDLAQALSTLGSIPVPYGTYEKVEFKIKFQSVANTPALTLLGTYTPSQGGAPVPVVLQLAGPFELKFEKKTPTTIDANTDYTALSTLALNILSGSVPESLFANATRTNGQIVISSTSNTQLYTPLWSLLEGLLKVEVKKH